MDQQMKRMRMSYD